MYKLYEPPAWILRNLREYGNCAISWKTFFHTPIWECVKVIYENASYVESKESKMIIIQTNQRKESNIYEC